MSVKYFFNLFYQAKFKKLFLSTQNCIFFRENFMKIAKILTITSSFIFTIFICSLLLSCSESKTKQEDVPKKAASSESFSSFLDFELTSLNNDKIIRLSDNLGKVVLVVFWATWCRACLHEIPELIDLRKTYDSSDLEIIAIALPRGNSKE